MLIDCDTCAVRGPACGDCVVTVLLGGPPAEGLRPGSGAVGAAGPPLPVDLDGAERAALAVLAGCGLVPPLRLVPVDPQERSRPGEEPDASPEREVS